MFKIVRENPKSFAAAVAVHIVLIAFLAVSLDWHSTNKVVSPEVEVVQAVMVDENKVKEEMRKLEQIEQKKRKQEEDRQKQLDKKANEAERKRKEEEKQIKALEKERAEKKRLAEKEAKKEAELKKKREQEEKRLAELEQKRKIEVERQRKAEEERKRKEEEAKRRAEEERIRKEQIAAEEAKLREIRQGELASEIERYKALIVKQIENKWLRPSGWKAGIGCNVLVRLVPGKGVAQVIDVRITKSCGQPLFDRSVETAVYSASPLPIPTAPELINEFRELNIMFNPED